MSNDALDNYDSVQNDFDTVINRYDEAQQSYDDVIESFDKSYQNQKESSAEEDQQFSQHDKDQMNSVERLFHSAHRARERFEYEDNSLRNRLQNAYGNLQYCKDEIRASAREHMRYEDPVVSSQIRHAEILLRQEREKQSSKKSRMTIRNHNEKDLEIVRRIIAEQKFDGLWNIDVKFVEKLTRKPFTRISTVNKY